MKIELDTPANANGVPRDSHWRGFSVYEPSQSSKDQPASHKTSQRLQPSQGSGSTRSRLLRSEGRATESWRCLSDRSNFAKADPGSPGVALEFFTLTTRFVFGQECDHASYVDVSLRFIVLEARLNAPAPPSHCERDARKEDFPANSCQTPFT